MRNNKMDERLKRIVDESESIVFFGGAGVSTESGIPDFRSEAGLYNAQKNYGYPPETMLSIDFFNSNTADFFKYYKENLINLDIQPNKAHFALAKLEREGKLKAIVTQNIDGLHQKAGSKTVYELHGSVLKNTCISCGKKHSVEYIIDEKNCKNMIPYCECGGIIKPDVVLYGEPLDMDTMSGAVRAISSCETLIVGGTSLVVYPAAGLVDYFRGKNLVLINRDETAFDNRANLVIHDSIGKVMDY